MPMGRRRTKNLHLPQGMALKRGRYYFGRNQEFIGDTFADAMEVYAEKIAAKAGQRPETFGDLVTAYFVSKTYRAKAVRTRKDNMAEYEALSPVFGAAPLGKVRPAHIAQYLEHRPAKVRGNREIALVSTIWNWGRAQGMTDLPNPCDGVRRNKETGRDRYVTDEELAAEWAVASEPLRDALDLHYLTGQRVADILKGSLTDVRDDALPVRQGKTQKPLMLDLHHKDGSLSELGMVLERIRIRQFKPGVVVSLALIRNERGQRMTYSALEQRHARARTKAGVDFNLQDLRAKHGTDREALEGLLATRKALGHSSVAMTEHYLRRRQGDRITPLPRKLRTD